MKFRLNTCTILILLGFFSLLLASCVQKEVRFYRQLPYPESEFIEKLEWTSEPYRYPGSGSDMHWWTWGIDDAIYTVEDDGANFGGKDWYAHVLRVKGIPPNHTVETVTDFDNIDFRAHIPNKLLRRYVCGPVAIDSALYVSIYDYDWDIPSKPLNYDTLYHRIKLFHSWYNLDSTWGNNMGFIDGYSKLGGVAGIIKSVDFGKTWTNIPNETTPRFFEPEFGAPAFLTFGKGNTETPEHLAPYVYAISNDGNWASGDNIRLGRVHRDSILNRNAWQFFIDAGKNNRPSWTSDIKKANPVFTDIGHTGHPTISYNKVLKRYFLLNYSDVIPHHENASPEESRKWNYQSELQIYESPNPWGPWYVVHTEMPWGGADHTAYLGQMPSKWFSADGLSGTILFAGDYTNRRPDDYYGFITQSFTLKLKLSK